jgi:hypothetical protein
MNVLENNNFLWKFVEARSNPLLPNNIIISNNSKDIFKDCCNSDTVEVWSGGRSGFGDGKWLMGDRAVETCTLKDLMV